MEIGPCIMFLFFGIRLMVFCLFVSFFFFFHFLSLSLSLLSLLFFFDQASFFFSFSFFFSPFFFFGIRLIVFDYIFVGKGMNW